MRVSSSLIILGLVLGGGCSEEEMDCSDICQAVQSCMAANADVNECADICEAQAVSSDVNRARVESCRDCLDSFGCGGATNACNDACNFLIVTIEVP